MNGLDPRCEALKDAARTFDNLARSLDYLAETANDKGLRLLLIGLSNQASAAQESINELLEAEVET